MTILVWVIIGILFVILATIGFYITIYHRFTNFINQDKDRINAFSKCCYDNLYEETFGVITNENKEKEMDLSPVEVKKDVVSTDDVNDDGSSDTIDNF